MIETIIKKIISGGQTGTDRAALNVAMRLGIPHGGWCPHERLAEDGVIDEQYRLVETPSADLAQRTEWNIRDSDGTCKARCWQAWHFNKEKPLLLVQACVCR